MTHQPKTTMFFLPAVFWALAPISASSDAGKRSTDLEFLLSSEDATVREEAVQVVVSKHRQFAATMQELATLFLDDPEKVGMAATAIRLLGEIRSDTSVPLLVNHLTFRVFYKETKRTQGPDDLYPCVGALIAIGLPSLDPLLKKVAATDDELFLRNAAVVIERMLGPTVGAAYLQERIEREPNADRQRRLRKAQQHVKNGEATKR